MTVLPAMQTLHYLLDPDLVFARHALVAAVCVGTASALLSGIVVLKRLAFVGQGISHAAFGGIGLVAVLGCSAAVGEAAIFLFCVASALAMAGLSRGRTHEDTAIGIVLVATMAFGSLTLALRFTLPQQFEWYRSFIAGAPTPAGWDALLFGSVTVAGATGMWLSLAVMAAVAAALWWCRRPLLCFVFDEQAARAAGVSPERMRRLIMVLLALVVVVGMKLVGVVLISAMLVLPGAIAGQVARRTGSFMLIGWIAAMIGVIGGLVVSFEINLQSGPCIVLVLVALYAIAAGWARLRGA